MDTNNRIASCLLTCRNYKYFDRYTCMLKIVSNNIILIPNFHGFTSCAYIHYPQTSQGFEDRTLWEHFRKYTCNLKATPLLEIVLHLHGALHLHMPLFCKAVPFFNALKHSTFKVLEAICHVNLPTELWKESVWRQNIVRTHQSNSILAIWKRRLSFQ